MSGSCFQVRASFPGADDARASVSCFDSRIVLARIEREFEELFDSDRKDLSYKDFNHFQRKIEEEGESEGLLGARRVAKNDAMRRGPIFRFSIDW